MSALQHIFCGVFLYLFVSEVFSEPVSAPIREREDTSNIAFINPTRNSSTGVSNPDKVPNAQDVSKVIYEGGSSSVSSTMQTNNGTEDVIEPPTTNISKTATDSSNITSTKSADTKPVHQGISIFNAEVPPQHDQDKPSVAKKGVSLPESEAEQPGKLATNLNSTGTSSNVIDKNISVISDDANLSNKSTSLNNTVIYKKPKVTESDDHVDANKSNENTISVNKVDPFLVHDKNNSSDYIVPIVAVILSVPLVAIFISIVYKRGTYWWQHRNYKRMDFLIEGMYHN